MSLDTFAGRAHDPRMDNAPKLIPGEQLRRQRLAYGVRQEDIGRRLGHTRDTIRAWEQHPGLDVRRQRLYLAALRELADAL